MKKRAIIVVIFISIIIEITFVKAIDINSNEKLDEKNNNILKIKKRDISPKDLLINFTLNKNKIKTKKSIDNNFFKSEYKKTHPSLDIEQTDKILAAYEDTRINDIAWTYLSEDGIYIDGVFFSMEGMIKYPSVDYWGADKRFFGTAVPDINLYNGGILPIFECSDVTDVDTYNLGFVDWSSSGFSKIKDVDIACDSSKNEWEFGTISLIANKEPDINNTPCVCYMDSYNSGKIHINWYDEYEGCHHTMCDIDSVNRIAYSVYDCLMSNEDNYNLLLRYDDFENWNSGEHIIIEISIDGIDLKYPTIAVNNKNIVILAAAIDDNIEDIICIYSLQGINGEFFSTFVANSASQEKFPQVSHIFKNKFLCTYIKNGDYYLSRSDDNGMSWKPSRQINDKNGIASEGYKKTDLCENANYTLWEGKNEDNIELFFANCLLPVNAPNIPYGPNRYGCITTCMCCEQYPGNYGGDYSTIGTDPHASKLKYRFYWGNGQGHSDWTRYYEPGVKCDPLWICYYFGGPGTKTIEIMVKAMDENGYESPWSEPLEVVLVWAGGHRKSIQSYVKYLNKAVFLFNLNLLYYHTLD